MEQDYQQYGETYTYTKSFVQRLPTGATIASATVSAVYNDTKASASSIISGTASTTSTTVSYTITGLATERDYLLTITATLSNSNVLIKKVILHCVDAL